MVNLVQASMMLDKRLVKTDCAAVFLLVLILLSCFVCFISAARHKAVMNAKNIKRTPTHGFFKPSCNSKKMAQCSPLQKQMHMNRTNANVTGQEKRVVPTGPNPLHNR